MNRLSIRLPPLVTVVLAIASPAFAGDRTVYEAKPGPGGGRHLVVLTGDEEYRGEEGLPMLAKILSQRHGFKCTILFPLADDGTINPDLGKTEAGTDALDSADGIVMMLRYRAWPDDAMKRFAAAVDRGVPIVALRTSTHAFNFPANSTSPFKHFNAFGKKVLGEGWVTHWGDNKTTSTLGVIESAAKDEPILRGVAEVFGDSGAYEAHPPADATILLRGKVLKGKSPASPPADAMRKRGSDKQEQAVNDPMMPVAWTRVNKLESGKANRAFTTTMGAATDLQSEGLRRLVVNAVYWGFNLDVPAKADVEYVDPYHPSAYAFKGYRKGVTPADHALGKSLPPR